MYASEVVLAALEDWIDGLELDSPFYLVGHSLGGYMSLTYAHRHPERVRAMVLAGETLFAAGPPDLLDPEDPLAAFEGRR